MATNSKIKSRATLREILKRLKAQGKKIVFTNGCFDLVHAGHVRLLDRSRALGDVLVVAVNSDSSLKRLKGPKRPLVGQVMRTEMLAGLGSVSYVTVFSEDTPAGIIRELKPDILVKGGDYRKDDIVGRHDVTRVVRIPLVKGISTTGLIKRIVSRYGNE